MFTPYNVSLFLTLQIRISFLAFNLENNFDKVLIYNGSSVSDPLIDDLSGTTVPADVHTNSDNVFVHFTSDSSIQKTGFLATITTYTGM